jgi:ABC-type uncharacterized transport system permease subunit
VSTPTPLAPGATGDLYAEAGMRADRDARPGAGTTQTRFGQAARSALAGLAPVLVTLVFITILLLVAGANPLAALGAMVSGAFGGTRNLADVVVAIVPLLLASAGMLVTFAAGLWNIGVEGQIVAGALGATWVVQAFGEAPPPAAVLLPLTILGGLAGGAAWGLLVGALKSFGGVHEIFAGLGLNYLALALTNYLIFGPWRPPDGATMSGTDPFPRAAWMPILGNTRASLPPILLALAAIALVYVLLRDTNWGLRLKAIGLNGQAAHRMGIDNKRAMLQAFALCGAMAGLAGSFQTTAVYHRLIPSISSGYGYLAQLGVLLSGLRAQWVPGIVLFFSAVQVGSPRLELRLMLDSSLGGVLQASMVLFFILVRGFRQRIESRRQRRAA